jgi:protease-4
MTLETETVLDRRRLRRRLVLWRVLAVVAAVAAIAAITMTSLGPDLGEKRQIARVTIQGMITDDRAQVRMLQRLGEAKHVRGVILFVNSPGGTTTGGEALFEAIRELAAKKPVVAQFGTVATSAAYIAGLAADHIVARGNTITGSVGVIFQWAEVSELMAKLGVKMNEVKSGPLKANPSPFQPLDEAGRRTAEEMVRESQRWFVGLVADRRKIATDAVPGLEQGRVYSGRDAIRHKLVDTLGGEKEARRWLEETRKVPAKLDIVDWKPRRDSEFSWLRLAASTLTHLLGGSRDSWATLLTDDDRLARLQLDGLVSVWQPSEK